MKTAISLPDKIFHEAELYARRAQKSRSQLYSQALEEFLARHAVDRVEEALDRVSAELGNRTDPFLSAVSRRILERSQW